MADTHELDIIIPVFNEGENITRVLDALHAAIQQHSYRVLICYDFPEDTTLAALDAYDNPGVDIERVLNPGRGPHAAVLAGFEASTAPAVFVFPADDDYNPPIIDSMVDMMQNGCEIVCASRFMKGGKMVDCPWLKALLVRSSAWVLHHIARIPTHDPSNGLRMFSRRVIETIEIESTEGFTYSIELLVKTNRLGWRICERPAEWYERGVGEGQSNFKVLKWLPAYLRWFWYAFATNVLVMHPNTVPLRENAAQ
ncbi:MAG: glycosyltransferase family 2 protein [Chloroflexota bacterium]